MILKKWKLFSFALCLSGSVFAQPNIGDIIKIHPLPLIKQEVVIEGRGIPSPYDERTMSIQKISKYHISRLPVRSITEVLSYIPGLDFRQRGIQGVQGDLSIRGGTTEQNLILINGFKMVDPQTGHHALNLPLLLTNVESIEVYKGSGTRIFGQNAMTGAVNFITKPKDLFSINAQISGGSFNNYGGQLSLSVPFKRLKQTFSAGYDRSAGYWHNSDYTNQNYFYDAFINTADNKHELKGMVGYSDKSFGANGFYTSWFPEQWESTQMAFSGLSYKFKSNNWTAMTKASLRTHRDEFRLIRFDPSFYTNKHFSEVLSMEQNVQYVNVLGVSSIGAELRIEDLNSSNLGKRNRQFTSAYADHSMKLFANKLKLVGSIHYFQTDLAQSTITKFLPGFEANYRITSNVKVFGNIGQSYRAPSYTDLYYQDPSNIGNPNLEPEFATNSEVGFEFSKYKSLRAKSIVFSFETALYRRNTTNMIDWVRSTTAVPNPWTPVNISSVLFHGIETKASFFISGNAKVLFLREVTIGYNYQEANHEFVDALGQQESRYVFTGLRNQLHVKLKLDISKYAFINISYRGVERIDMGAYSLIDAKLQSMNWRGLSCFMEVNNILDTQYVEAGYVQMPGRWGKIGLQYNFDKK